MKTFVAHFSFPIDKPDQPFTGGRLTALVRAPNVVKAVEKLKALLHDTKPRVSMLVNVKRIGLDSLTEMKTIPPSGLVTFIEWDDRAHDATMDVSPIFAEDRYGVTAYSPRESSEVPPFVEFD